MGDNVITNDALRVMSSCLLFIRSACVTHGRVPTSLHKILSELALHTAPNFKDLTSGAARSPDMLSNSHAWRRLSPSLSKSERGSKRYLVLRRFECSRGRSHHSPAAAGSSKRPSSQPGPNPLLRVQEREKMGMMCCGRCSGCARRKGVTA